MSMFLQTKKTFLRLFSIAVLLIMLGLGCKGVSQEELAVVRPVRLTYWTVFNDVAALEELARAYQATRPHVSINIRRVRQEEFDRLFVNALADDVGPDIVSVHVRELNKYAPRLSPMPPSVQVSNRVVSGQFVQEESVLTQTNAMPTARAVRQNYIGTVIDDVLVNGQIYGLPLAVDTLALYYNADLLDRAGVPEPPGNWEEFQQAVKAGTRFGQDGSINQSGVALGTGANINHASDIFAMLVLQNGWQLTRGNAVTFASGLDANAGKHPMLQTLRFYTDFSDPTKDTYTWDEKQNEALINFARGRSVFYFGFSFDRSRIRALNPQLRTEVIAVPQLNEARPVNVASYWVEAVVGKSKNKTDAWDFIRFLTLPENVQKYTQAVGAPSPLRSQLVGQESHPILGPFAVGLLNSQNWYRGRSISAAEGTIEKMIDDYRTPYGGETVTEQQKLQRDIAIIQNAAVSLQRTM